MDEDKRQFFQQLNEYCKIQPTDVITKRYDVYLNFLVDKPHYYFEFLELMRSANEEDEIFVHINNNGGYVDTTMQIINAMNECKAEITTCIEGACHSAASMILLSGDNVKVSKHSSMLCHYYSGMAYGKGSDIESQVLFDKDMYNKFYYQIYNKFLSKKEIQKMISGVDIWLSSEDILKRLKRVNK